MSVLIFRTFTGFLFGMTAALVIMEASFAQEPKQFDIICKIHGRKMIDYTADLNQSEGDNAPWDWHDTFRYAIDLENRRYRGLDWVDQAPSKIVRVTKTRFWFLERKNGFERYNLVTNRYYAWEHGSTYIIHVTTGKCRRAKFSGILGRVRRTR